MKRVSTESVNVLSGKKVYIGIDVHKESWHVTARTDGEEVFNGRIPASYHSLMKLLERFKDCQLKVAYEAGPCGFSLYDMLTEDGIDSNSGSSFPYPHRVRQQGENRQEGFKEARKAAGKRYAQEGACPHRRREDAPGTREDQATTRGPQGKRCPADKKQAPLLRYVLSLSRVNTDGAVPIFSGLRTCLVHLNILEQSLDILIHLYEYLTEEIREITKSVVELSYTDKYAQRMKLLRSIPGVGILTGMEILVELQDFARFKTSEQIASYIGLTPSEYSTGQYVHQGRITRCGNTRVRVALVESSWILVGRDPLMRAKYLKLKSMKGAKRAIVAIARKLIIRIRAMLLHNVPYMTGGSMVKAA